MKILYHDDLNFEKIPLIIDIKNTKKKADKKKFRPNMISIDRTPVSETKA